MDTNNEDKTTWKWKRGNPKTMWINMVDRNLEMGLSWKKLMTWEDYAERSVTMAGTWDKPRKRKRGWLAIAHGLELLKFFKILALENSSDHIISSSGFTPFLFVVIEVGTKNIYLIEDATECYLISWWIHGGSDW